MDTLHLTVLQNENTAKYVDPISLEIMKDPVIAADGITYEREFILEWFKKSQERGRPVMSPMTNIPLSSDRLEPNAEMREEIERFMINAIGSLSKNIDIKLNLSSDIYKELDRVASLQLLEKLCLRAPQIVVLGNESHGKSTLLERIIGLPIFPRDKNICTRCPIRVKIRRGEPSIAKITVVNKKLPNFKEGDKVQLKDSYYSTLNRDQDNFHPRVFVIKEVPPKSKLVLSASLKDNPDALLRRGKSYEYEAYHLEFIEKSKIKKTKKRMLTDYAPLDGIREMIKKYMDKLASFDEYGMITEKEIEVEIFLRNGLHIDILDIPGLVSTGSLNGQDLRTQTETLASEIIREEKDYSFFLLVNDVRVPSNQSRGCELVEKHALQDKTLGIFTKLDVFTDEDGDEVNELRKRLACQTPASFRVRHGWMGVCSKCVATSTTTSSTSTATAAASAFPTAVNSPNGEELKKLYAVENEELRILESKFSSLIRDNKLGIRCIRQKVQSLYDKFIVDEWVPHITKELNNYYDDKLHSLQALGLPAFPSAAYTETGNKFLMNNGFVLTIAMLQTEIQSRFVQLKSSVEENVLKLASRKGLWKTLEDYQEFVDSVPSTAHSDKNKNHHSQRECYSDDYSSSTSSSIKTVAVKADDVDSTIEKHVKSLSSLLSILCKDLFPAIKVSTLRNNFLDDEIFVTKKVTKLDRFPKLCQVIKAQLMECFHELMVAFAVWFQEEIEDSCLRRSTGDMIRLGEPAVMTREYFVQKEVLMCRLSWTNYSLLRSLPHVCIQQFRRFVQRMLQSCAELDFSSKLSTEDMHAGERAEYIGNMIIAKEVVHAINKFAWSRRMIS